MMEDGTAFNSNGTVMLGTLTLQGRRRGRTSVRRRLILTGPIMEMSIIRSGAGRQNREKRSIRSHQSLSFGTCGKVTLTVTG